MGTMKADNVYFPGSNIGSYMGYIPMTFTTCYNLDTTKVKKRIVGYYGDKPKGTMWDSGKCDDWFYACGSHVLFHQCDSYPGSSGSGILLFYKNGSVKVIGVHAFSLVPVGIIWNGGPAFTLLNIFSILSW